ncbi:NAD(P)/FAD-dependent oxidoreductase [Desulforamulus aquiferis]|uniref:FAD-dependent oxidoreductase n=1 Tax=Desulforamulus aquiferis TaxID=1397668 RepID=A0AAW7ZEP5_9FIRM|nr:FAD-dependent oxidoreductase [Desulforamulus aquiferis]MDO7787861.1 FAD-dependent oxidoreductase [Desulforamulus aquiferis]RYD04081.1 hypothetical protein N752_16965 [Desulforamulus aquiferis]
MNKKLKIAIIGSGPAGLACALECERLGVNADVFERDKSVGWIWPSVSVQLNIFESKMKDIRKYMAKSYGLDIKPLFECNHFVLKSPNARAEVSGNLGYFLARGKYVDSLENQLLRELQQTAMHYNRPADYKELSKKYDAVVIATGKETVAKELGVWEQKDLVNIYGGLALGDFTPGSSTIYFNTDYSGTGYARVTPINNTQAVVKIYNFESSISEIDSNFTHFLATEGLEHLEFLYHIKPPPFSVGKVTRFQKDNIYLTGRAAGLTERLTGIGSVGALISGIFAARAIIKGKEYEAMVKPLQDHIENISAFRDRMKSLTNKDFDRIITLIDTPGVKQTIYNSGFNLTDIFGSVIKKVNKLISAE